MTEKREAIIGVSSLYGKKLGMSCVFTEDGVRVPMTLIEISENCIYSSNSDNNALIIANHQCKEKHINNPQVAEYNKVNLPFFKNRMQVYFDINNEEYDAESLNGLYLSGDLSSVFYLGQKINVRARSIGKGTAGGHKRHGFAINNQSGGSKTRRSIGSTGQRQDPGKVFKGKKMPGRLGNKEVTVCNLEVVYIGENFIGVKGCVPGSKNSTVRISPAKSLHSQFMPVKFENRIEIKENE